MPGCSPNKDYSNIKLEYFSFYVSSLLNHRDFIKARDELSKYILEGPKDKLDETENTQPSIFLISQSIYQVIKKETKVDLSKANFFAGHSLGEYSALTASESLKFKQTIKLVKKEIFHHLYSKRN